MANTMQCLSVALLFTKAFVACAATGSNDEEILLENIDFLTFTQGVKVKTRHPGKPATQVKCLGGSAGCDSFTPVSVHCYNKGFKEGEIKWKCEAKDMPKNYFFSNVDVVCEEIENPEGLDIILKGSCWLTYKIEKKGHQENNWEHKQQENWKHAHDHFKYFYKHHQGHSRRTDTEFESNLMLILQTIVSLAICMCFCCFCCA